MYKIPAIRYSLISLKMPI